MLLVDKIGFKNFKSRIQMKISNTWTYARGELELNWEKRYTCSLNHCCIINVRCFLDKAIWNLSRIHPHNHYFFELIYIVGHFVDFGIRRNCVYAKVSEWRGEGRAVLNRWEKIVLFIKTLFNYLTVFFALLSFIIMFNWNCINNCVHVTVDLSYVT